MSSNQSGIAFVLGGISVPQNAAMNLQQDLRPIGGASIRRMMNGRGVKQSHWNKLQILLSAEGMSPPGLSQLDYTGILVFKSGVPRAIRSDSNIITLPAARRSDAGFLPFGKAYFPRGSSVFTPVSIVSNTATLTTVSGAISYSVFYYPEINVIGDPPNEEFDESSGDFSWSLTLEEI